MGIKDLKGKPLSRKEYERRSNDVLSQGGIMFDIHGDHVTISVSEDAHNKIEAEAARQGKTVDELLQETWQAHVDEAMEKHRKEKERPN